MIFDIVILSSNKYAQFTATLVASIMENNIQTQRINFHILEPDEDPLTEQTKISFSMLQKRYENLCFIYYRICHEYLVKKFGGLNTGENAIPSIYARLLIPDLLDASISRALMLDVDAICLSSFSELFSTNLDGFHVAGVLDTMDKRNRTAIGLTVDDSYINCGLVLWNLDKCRKDGISDKLIALARRFEQDPFLDQGVLNSVLHKTTKILSPKYNMRTRYALYSRNQIMKLYDFTSFYSQAELDEALANPCFVHYTSRFRLMLYNEKSTEIFRNEYFYYRSITPFSGSPLPSDTRSKKTKAREMLSELMPKLMPKLLFFINKIVRR
jgi:lipopolysaccharide biosynthesis glycosyltransferase